MVAAVTSGEHGRMIESSRRTGCYLVLLAYDRLFKVSSVNPLLQSSWTAVVWADAHNGE